MEVHLFFTLGDHHYDKKSQANEHVMLPVRVFLQVCIPAECGQNPDVSV